MSGNYLLGQRHDLYRYWLLKYQQYLHYHARDARREYNQAAAALAEYPPRRRLLHSERQCNCSNDYHMCSEI